MRKLLIVDPTLVSLEGHSYQYDRAFFSAARVVFDDVILYADKSFRDSSYQPLPCRAVLNRLPLDNLKRWGNTFFHTLGPRARRMSESDTAAHSTVVPNTWSWTLRLAKRLRAWDLHSVLSRILLEQRGDVSSDIHVFFQHAHLAEILAADRLQKIDPFKGAAVTLHLLLRYSPELVNAGFFSAPAFAELLRRLERAGSPRVRFLTDSERLASEYRSLGVRNIVTLPIPIQFPEADENMPSEQSLYVSFLGSSRVEKGFCELPRLLSALLSRPTLMPLRCLIQITRDSADPRIRLTVASLRELRDRSPPGAIELLDSPVPTQEYYAWLRRSRLVVLPYLSQKYNASTSGVFAEAVWLGTPVLVPSESWMSDIVHEAVRVHGYRIGEVFTDLEEIPALIIKMTSALDAYRKGVSEFSRIWRRIHNPEMCVKTFLAAIS